MDTLTVLIVDDETGMRMAVTRALADYTVTLPEIGDGVSFRIIEAATGEEAVERCARELPDIMLLDYKLPGISGLDVLEKVSTEQHDMLIIMITAYATIETAVIATKHGAYDFLPKPFTPAELRSVIRKAAGRFILLRQARRLAEEKRKLRFQFISVLVHELKAPLAAIDGYLQILDSRTLGDDIGSYGQVINRSMVRLVGMRKLITDLLDMTRIESGEKRREFTEVDVTAMARQAIETALAEKNGRAIDVTLHTPGPVAMQADRSEIEIILNNLFTNAVKYNRDGGSVDIRITGADDRVEIEVADTGIGLTEEEAAKLFNEFVRIKNEKTRHILGSGLGLSTVKKLALLYDGEVAVKSRPSAGSTFTVTLRKNPAAGREG